MGGTPFEIECEEDPYEVFKSLLLFRGRECERARDLDRERERVRDPARLDGLDKVVAWTLPAGIPPFTWWWWTFLMLLVLRLWVDLLSAEI